MSMKISAACGCHVGRRRANNEDNFIFDGNCLDSENRGLKDIWAFSRPLQKRELFAVFDGMGGESFGELASHTAAKYVQNKKKTIFERLVSPEKYMENLCQEANVAVVQKAKELKITHMGTTIVGLLIDGKSAVVGNLGDSRAYRLRANELIQISKDHVSQNREGQRSKPPLTQHLGIDPQDLFIEPFVSPVEMKVGDKFLLCSDGLTDMVCDEDIEAILYSANTPQECVYSLMSKALDNGGRDNITVIVVIVE